MPYNSTWPPRATWLRELCRGQANKNMSEQEELGGKSPFFFLRWPPTESMGQALGVKAVGASAPEAA